MNSPYEHISSIFKEYTAESRVLRSFTNLSNTVIQTALSGQSKFVFELLQNADDAYDRGQNSIQVQFLVQGNFFIVHHNGKGFDYYDVERICDYASQIKEVKANDLSKTGYKGLGFKSLFNLADTIYICSNGYSFRFDRTFWPNPENRPWQIIPIWCPPNELPHHEKNSYSSPVNIILKVKDINQLKLQLEEVIEKPDLLLFLHRVNCLNISFGNEDYVIERKMEGFGPFRKVTFLKNQTLESTWLTIAYTMPVSPKIQNIVLSGSRFIYPDKVKNTTKISFIFALRSNEACSEIIKIKGLCYNTLPTQLHLNLPYHVNSFFILNLDRTQLHENEWNEFLIEIIGQLQLSFLKDLTSDHNLKNYVISLFVREIEHPYRSFAQAFLRGFTHVKKIVDWIPSYKGTHLLKLGDVWNDDIDFFKKFENVYDQKISPYLIDHDVLDRDTLKPSEEVELFRFLNLFKDFAQKYFPQFNKSSYVDFISYVYDRIKTNSQNCYKLRSVSFLVTKYGSLISPQKATVEDPENPIPEFLLFNPIDNDYLPQENHEAIISWLQQMGAKVLRTPHQIIQESALYWIDSNILHKIMNEKNHLDIVEYLAKNIDLLSPMEVSMLEKLLVLTDNKTFRLAKSCFLPNVVPLKELSDVVTKESKLSSVYDMNSLRHFFTRIGVKTRIKPMNVIQKVLDWIKNKSIYKMVTKDNYNVIIEYIAENLLLVERNLKDMEKETLKIIPILTMGHKLMPAKYCYFDYAVPTVKGLENIINSNELVSSNMSRDMFRFLVGLGVSEQISVVDILQKSVIHWIKEGTVADKINKENHLAIFEYVASQLYYLQKRLDKKDRSELRKIVILTENDTFKPAYTCFWPESVIGEGYNEEIPGISAIISPDELVSSNYDVKKFKETFKYFGVRYLNFFTIWRTYIDYLIKPENVKWFFHQLTTLWEKNQVPNDVLAKLKLSHLLARNMEIYYPKDLYSTKFSSIHYIDPHKLPILAYRYLPEELEMELGFKTNLSLSCISGLYRALEKRKLLGEKATLTFFKTLLEQVKLKSKTEIKSYRFKLLSKENKLVFADNLNYFEEEEAECELTECYLKRIPGMSHVETLELAKCCRVNICPFNREVKPIRGASNNSLKEFYLERLPVIVFQEAKAHNEIYSKILKKLFEEADSIKLYECQRIRVQYPFGKPTHLQKNFNKFTLHVVNQWKDYEIQIHEHLSQILSLKTDIIEITDYEDYQDLLNRYNFEDQKDIKAIQEELQCLKLKKTEMSCSLGDEEDSEDDDDSIDDVETSESSSGESSDDESLFVISANDMVTRKASVHEVKVEESEIVPVKEKVTVGVKCVDVDLPYPSLPSRKASIRDEAKIDPFDLVPDFPNFKDVEVSNSFKQLDVKLETDMKRKTEENFVKDYMHNKLTERTGDFLINNTINENIFEEDYEENGAKMRVCLGEYVFNLLQKQYIKKYPGCQCGTLFNTFTLNWKTHRIEIKWLNSKEDKQQLYDFELRKNGEVRRLIRVELNDVKNDNSFILNHQNMMTLVNKQPKSSLKYSSFHVLREQSCDVSEKKNYPVAVYKVVAMQ